MINPGASKTGKGINTDNGRPIYSQEAYLYTFRADRFMGVSKIIIGRRDRIDLPELGYRNIKAKIDTGAYGSVIHCSRIEVVHKNGKDVLSFVLLDPAHPKFKNKLHYFEHFKDKLVKNSSGESEHRYIIVTGIIIFGKKISTEFSLTDRSQMKYPILLGRKFLGHRFMVDVNLRDLSYKLKLKH